MRFRLPGLLTVAALVAALLALPDSLPAKASCRIRVDTILASRNGKGVDSQLRRHIGELQSMFNYTSYQLLGSKSLNLKPGQTGMVSLPGNRRLKITPHKIRGKRADIALQMMKNQRTVFQTQIQLLNRGSLFVGGPRYQNGNLIFQISGAF